MENMSTDVSSVERVHANNYFERNCGFFFFYWSTL